jgi:methylated-DNA-[protein]-cysteine S-methyltransferase
MTETGFILFETAIGLCGLVWGERGIVGAQLPEGDGEQARARILRRFPEARETPPPPHVREAVDEIVALIAGERRDLHAIALDMAEVPEFHRRVYAVARDILPGEVLTYGEVARRIGEPGAAQAVGQALGKNPFPIIVPCHRVLAAGGKTGGFSARGGVETKFRLLTIERARTSAEPSLFDDDAAFGFAPPPKPPTRNRRP